MLRARRRSPILATIIGVILSPIFSTVAIGGEATVVRHPAFGAYAEFGSCPDVQPPPAGTTCVDNIVFIAAVSTVEGGGSLAPKLMEWSVFAETYLLEFTGTEEPIVTVLRTGFGDIQGEFTIDTVHLQTATADLVLPMSDGGTFDFTATWTAISDRQHFGNDGPDTGLPRHYNDPCLTVNAHGHQKFTVAAMSGNAEWRSGAFVHGVSDSRDLQ